VLEMEEPSLAQASSPTVVTAVGASPAGIWATLEDLDAQELRLYALGFGVIR